MQTVRKSVRVERRSGYEEITDLPSVSFGRGSMVCMFCAGYGGGCGREERRATLAFALGFVTGQEDAT